jgi:hypothetical protein
MLIQGPKYSNVGKYIFFIYLKLSNFIYKKLSDLKDINIRTNGKNSPKKWYNAGSGPLGPGGQLKNCP